MPTNAFALDSFVGRSRELAQVAKLLGGARLVTLTGAPGIGKTRLAGAVASGVGETYPDGTWMVDLAPIREEALVAQSVASALGLREMASLDPAESLVSYVRDRHLLIVLDNCEHLIDPCVSLAEVCQAVQHSCRQFLDAQHPHPGKGPVNRLRSPDLPEGGCRAAAR